MANNQFTKNEAIFFEDLVDKFEPNNLHANQATTRQASTSFFDKNGIVERRDSQLMIETSEGRDITGQNKDILQLTVPVSISDADIVNHAFTLNTNELKEGRHRDRAVQAANMFLSNKLDLRVANKIVSHGSLCITSTGEFADYDDLAKAETEMMNREINIAQARCMNLNPRAARKASSVIASRESGIQQKEAYEASMLPSVAGFSTHKANVIPSVLAAGSAGTTVNGADQSHAPVVFDSNSTTSADNRYGLLAVTSQSGITPGTSFTISGVESVGMVSKSPTGSLQTFKVISRANNVLTITPAIIPADGALASQRAYANCSTTPANGATLTILNTNAVQPITFFKEDAVEILTTSCADPDLSSTMAVMRASTDSGIEILFAKEASITDLSVQYRLSFMASAHVLENQMVGTMLANQAANFGG